MDGFTLRLINPPVGAVTWHADFAENTFSYDPWADSGWLGIGETWEYPSDPLGCTTLRILVLDVNNNILLNVTGLGPVVDGAEIVYDCSTAPLPTPPPESMLETMIPLMIVVMMMGMMMKVMEGAFEPVEPKPKPLYPGGPPPGYEPVR